MKVLFFLTAIAFLCCSKSDKMKAGGILIKIEDFAFDKNASCFDKINPKILNKSLSPYKIGVITFSNNTNNEIWVFAEEKFDMLFYQSSKIKVLNEKDEVIEENLANVFSNIKVKILPNSSKCFMTYFTISDRGNYQEFQIDYLTDTVNLNMVSKNIRK